MMFMEETVMSMFIAVHSAV